MILFPSNFLKTSGILARSQIVLEAEPKKHRGNNPTEHNLSENSYSAAYPLLIGMSDIYPSTFLCQENNSHDNNIYMLVIFSRRWDKQYTLTHGVPSFSIHPNTYGSLKTVNHIRVKLIFSDSFGHSKQWNNSVHLLLFCVFLVGTAC